MITAERFFAGFSANYRPLTVSTRGWRISTYSWSGNLASSAWTSRTAVSPVESEITCSSTCAWFAFGFVTGGRLPLRRASLASLDAGDPRAPEFGRFRDLAMLDRFDCARRALDRRERVPVRVAAHQVVEGRDPVLPLRELRIVGADVLEEEQAPARLQDARDLAQRRFLVRDAAENEGHDHGVEGCVREREAFDARIDDLRGRRDLLGALNETTAHVLVRLGQHQPRHRLGIVRQIEPGSGPDLERRSLGGSEKLPALLAQTGLL